ncbi:MAG TPA: ferrochelatase [Candidatus Limnocylindria bacterium]|nr:ferrochelatase [Candidatus Limnocylindria bacterium]
MSRTGVVLMTYGAPAGRDDVAAYLARVRGDREPSGELVAEFVARYERIGWSPLVRITRAQAAALEAALGGGWRTAAGMRYSAPSIDDAVGSLGDVGEVVGIVMSPQRSEVLMGGYERALDEACAGRGIPVRVAGAWHREPAFVDALAGRVREAVAEREPDGPIIFTAHSLPRRVFDGEPGYIAQLRETAELVAGQLGLAADRWRWAYQSAGHTREEWLGPDLKELFPVVAASGARDVLVVPVQFLADHLEVLFDLDIAAAAEARAAGLAYRRTRMLNTDPRFIGALAAIARATSRRAALSASP